MSTSISTSFVTIFDAEVKQAYQQDRSLAGKSRRFIDEIGGTITSQQVDVAVKANPNIVGEVNSTRFLLMDKNYSIFDLE